MWESDDNRWNKILKDDADDGGRMKPMTLEHMQVEG